MKRTLKASVALTAAATTAMLLQGVGLAATPPTGEHIVGQSSIEPAYNSANGSLVYLSTPSGATVNPNDHNVAPIYIVVYPTSAASSVGPLNCQDTTSVGTTENCPDHGPEIAGLAQAVDSAVYGKGVLGHDHLVGIASTGGDFNVLWEPVVVLFNDVTTANTTHVTTLTQLRALEQAQAVTEIPLPPATFHCAAVSAAVYNHGTPVGQ